VTRAAAGLLQIGVYILIKHELHVAGAASAAFRFGPWFRRAGAYPGVCSW